MNIFFYRTFHENNKRRSLFADELLCGQTPNDLMGNLMGKRHFMNNKEHFLKICAPDHCFAARGKCIIIFRKQPCIQCKMWEGKIFRKQEIYATVTSFLRWIWNVRQYIWANWIFQASGAITDNQMVKTIIIIFKGNNLPQSGVRDVDILLHFNRKVGWRYRTVMLSVPKGSIMANNDIEIRASNKI